MVSSARVRVATASPATQATRQATMTQLESLARAAAQNKADFLLLPEAYLGGYPRGSDFGCKIGGRTEEGRDEFRRYFRDAVDLGDCVGVGGAGGLEKWVKRELEVGRRAEDGGDEMDDGGKGRGDGTREELERIARETGVFVVVGLVERAGGSLYCAVVYVCPRRGVVGKRRKVMPTGTERLIWAQGSPATLKAVSTTIRGIRINLAAAICWENYMPLLRQSLYAQNINLYFAPTADGRDTWLPLMRTIGIEGRCFVVTSNMCVRGEGDDSSNNPSTSKTIPAPAPPRHQSHARRNSCLTEEGFEIALPQPTASSSSRTASSFLEGCDDDANNNNSNNNSYIGTSGSNISTASLSPPTPKVAGIPTSAPAPVPVPAPASIKESKPTTMTTEASTTTFISRGGSSIVSPFGEVLAGPQWEDDAGIIYADIDLEDCVRGRLDLDAAGSYSRNDSFKFSVEGLDLDPLPYYV